MLINFSLPEIGDEQTEGELLAWQELEGTWGAASSCVGFLISLGAILEKDGFDEIRDTFVPRVQLVLPGVFPRIVPGYATLMWFTSKVICY